MWLGMVLAISFLETPLKFRAPGVTVPIGLGIGRLVFRALNIVEAVFAVTLLAAIYLERPTTLIAIAVWIAPLALALQLGVIRPRLTARSNAILNGLDAPRSRAHHAYIGLEAVKVVVLMLTGVLLLAIAAGGQLSPMRPSSMPASSSALSEVKRSTSSPPSQRSRPTVTDLRSLARIRHVPPWSSQRCINKTASSPTYALSVILPASTVMSPIRPAAHKLTELSVVAPPDTAPWTRAPNTELEGFPPQPECLYTAEDHAFVEHRINNRPRKTHGWKSPTQVLDTLIKTA